MARPATHTPEAFLDCAVELFAERGARAVTMAAVAKAAKAPSGSVYHRFRDRPALLAALWLRAVSAFGEAFLDQLGEVPTPADAVETAAWMIEWCRRHPRDAVVLNAGRSAFSPESWTADATSVLETVENARDRAVRGRLEQVAQAGGRPVDEVIFAVVEMPLVVVRRHLPGAIPESAVDLSRRLASRIVLGCGA